MRPWLILLAACDGASSDLGRDLPLQLAGGGQYRPGPFPADEGGPAAIDVVTAHATVGVASLTERMSGHLAADARSAIIGLGLDPAGCSPTSTSVDGAWIIPAGPLDVVNSGDLPTVNQRYGLQADTPFGPAQLLLAAGGADGKIGARACFDFVVTPAYEFQDAGIPNELVITLSWESRADLDLHVIDPSGNEAFYGQPNTYQPAPGTIDPPGAYLQGGILDRDANANCASERFPRESVVWYAGHAPPSGAYTVRVEAQDLCGDPGDAVWDVIATRQTAELGHTRGLATQLDVEHGPHGRGAGITALTFTLP